MRLSTNSSIGVGFVLLAAAVAILLYGLSDTGNVSQTTVDPTDRGGTTKTP
ncbi:MAG TPA: hypothetical protein VJ740_00075 [Hyphomicrobiaceae bacterium]|nr:hypothetical protein [Hyphomicrobiaceae bacterium]